MTDDLSDWIPVSEAVKLVPSPKPGKKTSLSTVYRWINEGRLECRRNGRWRFVRRSEVVQLLAPVAPRPGRRPEALTRREWDERERQAVEHLRREGLL